MHCEIFWNTLPPTNLWYELQHGVGEERPDGQADEVGQHFGEIGLLGEGDQEEAEQRRQVDQSDRQKPVTPHCHGGNRKSRVNNRRGLGSLLWRNRTSHV